MVQEEEEKKELSVHARVRVVWLEQSRGTGSGRLELEEEMRSSGLCLWQARVCWRWQQFAGVVVLVQVALLLGCRR